MSKTQGDRERDLVKSYRAKGMLAPNFPPIDLFELCQVGYPSPIKGELLPRLYGGTDVDNKLIPPKDAPWCRVADVIALLERSGIDFYSLKPVEED